MFSIKTDRDILMVNYLIGGGGRLMHGASEDDLFDFKRKKN